MVLILAWGLAVAAGAPDAVGQRPRGRAAVGSDAAAKAHRVFRARLREARTAAAVEAIASEIEQVLPGAAQPSPTDVSGLLASYEGNPELTYHRAAPPQRAALDRRLWADATERSLELQADARPQDAPELAELARKRLPDRSGLADRLVARGLEAASKDIGSLRQADVEALARLYDKDPTRAGRARDLRRRWLDHQREHRLGPSDAEDRVVLAGQYLALLGDAATAATLLQDALRIDPQSQTAAAALERLGYRKVGDRWLPPGQETARPEPPRPAATPTQQPAGSLIGLTRDDVLRKLGKPDRIARVASQGRIVEQWIYPLGGGRGSQYVDFIGRAGKAEPTVVFFDTLP